MKEKTMRYPGHIEKMRMLRETGTMAVRLLANGLYSRKGLFAPEHIGRHPECVEYLLKGLRDRGVVYEETIDELP